MRLGHVEFDSASGELRQGDNLTRLEPQPAAVLALLASRPGELVSHDEIRREIWGDTVHVNVAENLHYCIRHIRLAVGDTARNSRFIETIPRRGYRLAVPAHDSAPATPAPPQRNGRPLAVLRSPRLWVAAGIVVAALIAEQRPNRHHQIAVTIVKALHDVVY